MSSKEEASHEALTCEQATQEPYSLPAKQSFKHAAAKGNIVPEVRLTGHNHWREVRRSRLLRCPAELMEYENAHELRCRETRWETR